MEKYHIKKYASYIAMMVVFFASTAFAKVSIEPSRVEAKVEPGNSFEQQFVLKNIGDTPTTVMMDWRNRTRDTLIEDWLEIDQELIELQPGEEGTVGCKVTIPEGAVGEYNAWFVMTEGDPQKMYGGVASIAVRTSVPLYITVKGTEKYDFEVKEVTVVNRNSFGLDVKLRNTGNVHIRPTGNIYITNLNTAEEYIMTFNEVHWGIIPDKLHKYLNRMEEGVLLEDGDYKAVIHIESGEAESNIKSWDSEVIFNIKGNVGKVTKGAIESE